MTGGSHYKSKHAQQPDLPLELAHCPLGTVVPVGCGARSRCGPSSLFQWVSEARVRSRTRESLRETLCTAPFIVCSGRLRSARPPGRSRSGDRAGLLALPQAPAHWPPLLPLPLCAGRVWNNVIAQRSQEAGSSLAAAAATTTTGWGVNGVRRLPGRAAPRLPRPAPLSAVRGE